MSAAANDVAVSAQRRPVVGRGIDHGRDPEGEAAVAEEGRLCRKNVSTIFVSIASYRDSQCQYTIQDLFEKARHPERVVVGVCLQVAEEDVDHFLLDIGRWSSQIRTYLLRHTEAKGPCYARAIVQQALFRGEDYYFQIDSHFRFARDWDALCIEQLTLCASHKPILTSYASSYTLPRDWKPGGPDQACLCTGSLVSILCADTWGDRNQDDPFLRIKTRVCRSDFDHVPPPALFWTARFAFSRGNVVSEVPYDAHLEYLFFGEEIGMTARLWTAGWDLFNPTRAIAYHLGSRAHRYWFREVQTSQEEVQRETEAKFRVCGLLGHEWPDGRSHAVPPPPFGLGTARTLTDYERFAGVNFREQSIQDRGRYGGLPKDLFAPEWAEEERERLSMATQMQDPVSWAGTGSTKAMQRPSVANDILRASQQQSVEAEQAKGYTLMRIQALQARLHSARTEEEAEVELELSRVFCTLGRLEFAVTGDARKADEAFSRALQHARALSNGAVLSPPPEFDDGGAKESMWRASVASAESGAQLGLQRHTDAKRALHKALCLLGEALAAAADSGPPLCLEQLAIDVLDAVHATHEQTDDRSGLERFIQGVHALLLGLHRASGEAPPASAPPRLTAATSRPNVPAEGGGEAPISLRARLLERAVLVCIATGRATDLAVARTAFTHFREGRESANLVKLLGMLQSSGHLL